MRHRRRPCTEAPTGTSATIASTHCTASTELPASCIHFPRSISDGPVFNTNSTHKSQASNALHSSCAGSIGSTANSYNQPCSSGTVYQSAGTNPCTASQQQHLKSHKFERHHKSLFSLDRKSRSQKHTFSFLCILTHPKYFHLSRATMLDPQTRLRQKRSKPNAGTIPNDPLEAP